MIELMKLHNLIKGATLKFKYMCHKAYDHCNNLTPPTTDMARFRCQWQGDRKHPRHALFLKNRTFVHHIQLYNRHQYEVD